MTLNAQTMQLDEPLAPSAEQRAGPLPLRASVLIALRQTKAGIVPLFLAALAIQAATILFAVPAISALLELVLSSAGVQNLTDRNLTLVLGYPLAFSLLLLLVVVALVAVSIELTTIVVIAKRQQFGQSLGIRAIITEVASAMRMVLHYQSPLLMVYVFVIMPIGGLGLFSVITRDIAIPMFISGEMMKTPVSAILYSAGIAVAVYLNIRLAFMFPLLVIEKTTTVRAAVVSIAATRRQSLRIAVVIGLMCGAAILATTLLAEVVLLASALSDLLFPAASVFTASIGYGIVTVGAAIILSFALVIIVQTLTAAYRFRLGHTSAAGSVGKAVMNDGGKPVGSRKSRRRMGTAMVGAILVGGVVVSSISVLPPAVGAEPDSGGAAVIAHRGFIGGGVENTISALEAAAEVDPDYVEIDAQETKDGRFILSHDVNLWLVSGENVNTYELTLEEAVGMTLSVGGFSDKMSSMTDYVERAEELGVTLLIELKMHGHESADVVDRFLGQLDSIGSTSKHIYHSLSRDVVEELKAKRPALTVGRTIAASVGDVADGPCDFIVVEQSFFDQSFVDYARATGKKLFVWTVNDESSISAYLRLPVDGIVTDRPDLAMSARASIADEQGSSPWLRDALDRFTLF